MEGRNPDRLATAKVFISSTAEDLRSYRAAARDAVVSVEMLPKMMEYFGASGEQPPLAACLDKVSQCDVIVVIVAHRYGWVPPDQAPGEHKSITWLECERAGAEGKEVLAFVVDSEMPWAEEQREEYEMVKALREGRATPLHLTTIQRNMAHLRAFEAWLDGGRLRASFTSPEDLRGKVADALREWRSRRPGHQDRLTTGGAAADPSKYLRALLAHTAFIDIRGLQVGAGKAYRFPIEDLFISLTTAAASHPEERAAESDLEDEAGRKRRAHVPLHRALSSPRLVVVGDPGSGKTTFLRRVAHALCETQLGDDGDAAKARLNIEDRPLPILVRLSDLAAYIEAHGRAHDAPAIRESAAWLLHFLVAMSRDEAWGLDGAFFQAQVHRGALVMLDGLDEVPDRAARESIARLIENIAITHLGARLVVTSRPGGEAGVALLPGFNHVQIEPLDRRTVLAFLERWCQGLWPDSPSDAVRHLHELASALERPAIARMATNPVMLTALAVVHWNERRLPEQRADLYESIIKWLSRQREQRQGRPTAERCVEMLQELALSMHGHDGGRQVQVTRRWAAEAVAGQLHEAPTRARVAEAEKFLDAEEMDSGIVIGRGNEVRFWHLSFQEFLAAKAIGARSEVEQRSVLIEKRTLYTHEWREVVLLLGGILLAQGRPKLDGFISAVLDDLGPTPSLADEARCVGLLGAIHRDLAPLRYVIADARLRRLLEQVLGVFEAASAGSIPTDVRIEAAEALGWAGDPRLGFDNPQRWVTIPAGPFFMGAQNRDPKRARFDAAAKDEESPVHEVYLDEFQIGRYPVTVGEYREFIDAGGYSDRRWFVAGFDLGEGEIPDEIETPEAWRTQLQFPNRPIVGVSWYEAMAFCAWARCRLPTEAEWERAARGTEGRAFPWGDAAPDPSRLNYHNGLGRPTPVGVFPDGATPDGIHDMAGNVNEWCLDAWASDAYATSDRRNPQGPERREGRILRGGSFLSEFRGIRAAERIGTQPFRRGADLGFRVVRTGDRGHL